VAGQDSRVGDRQTASMRIKLKYPDVETFIQKYAVNISRGGIFIATKSPKAVGTFVKFEFLLSDATSSSIIRGEGQVQWTKEFDPQNPAKAHGMGVKFTRLDRDSQGVIDRALRWRAEHGTNPRVPVPVPTSSAHTISTATRDESGEVTLPDAREGSRADRLPEREPSQANPLPQPPEQDDLPPVMAPPVIAPPAMAPPVLAPPPPPIAVGPPIELPPEPAAAMPVGRGETRPIAIPGDDELPPLGRPADVHTRPIPVDMPLGRKRPADEIDALVSEWGLSEEKLAKILKRSRKRMGVEATAELERLLLKPPKLPTPTKAEALAQLGPLLARGNKSGGRNGTSH
jgi:molecular chaperone DnaK